MSDISNVPASPISTIESGKLNMESIMTDKGEPIESNDATTTTTTTTTNTTQTQKGVAGRINYDTWNKVTKDLITQVEEEDEQEKIQEQKKLGLGGKYARSADEAIEREKAAKLQQTKRTLDTFKKRETSIIQNLSDLLHPKETTTTTKDPITTVRITRDLLDAGKRVVSIMDVNGIDMEHSKIVLTSDLSLLESTMPVNSDAKSYQEDAENEIIEENEETKANIDDGDGDATKSDQKESLPPPKKEQQQQQRTIFGVIKVFLSNIQNCTIIVKCKIITGTIEMHNCHNVTIQIEKDATVATVQVDLSSNINLHFYDAVSGKHIPGTKNILYWGEDKDDRIFHAGVSNMHICIYRDGYIETETTVDYMKDGAEQIGNSVPEEYQFITSCIKNDNGTTLNGYQLITENVVRSGNTTGKNVRAMTPREIAAEKEKRDKAAKYAIKMADDMIQIKDKDGNVLVKKAETTENELAPTPSTGKDADIVEEVYTSMSVAEIQDVIAECDQLKIRGNEAFAAGEYGQAILHYSLCIDKASELPDTDNDNKIDNGSSAKSSLYPRDVVYSNRSAAFLKLGQHDKAESDATMALQINPNNIKANFRKGLALHASGKYAEALPILASAYKMEPHNKQIKQAIQFCEVRLEQEYRQRMSQS